MCHVLHPLAGDGIVDIHIEVSVMLCHNETTNDESG